MMVARKVVAMVVQMVDTRAVLKVGCLVGWMAESMAGQLAALTALTLAD